MMQNKRIFLKIIGWPFISQVISSIIYFLRYFRQFSWFQKLVKDILSKNVQCPTCHIQESEPVKTIIESENILVAIEVQPTARRLCPCPPRISNNSSRILLPEIPLKNGRKWHRLVRQKRPSKAMLPQVQGVRCTWWPHRKAILHPSLVYLYWRTIYVTRCLRRGLLNHQGVPALVYNPGRGPSAARHLSSG